MGAARFFLVCLLSLCSVSAFAATWFRPAKDGWSDYRAGSADAACNQAWTGAFIKVGSTYTLTSTSSFSATCTFQYKSSIVGEVKTYTNQIYQEGCTKTTCVCPAGSEYDETIHDCKQDKCAATKGQEVSHSQKIAEIVDGHLSPLTDPPVSVCSGSCLYGNPGSTSDAYRFVSGNPTGVWENYTYIGTGASCTASASTPSPSAPPSRSPSASKSNECTNKVEDAEGRVHYSCLATDSHTEPGSMTCGTVNGQVVCTSKKPTPSKKDTTVETDVTETPNANGSKTTDTTSTTTVTSCTGANACTTTTTVNNNTSSTNADGSQGNSSSSCTGPGCAGGGTGTEDGGEDQSEEEEEPADEVAGEQCVETLSCTGDVIQCAILKKQKEQACMWDYEKSKGTIESEIAKDEYQVKEGEHDMSGLFSSALGAARWLPATCPAPISKTLHSGPTVELSWQPTCDFAMGIAPVIVGGACLFFAIYVGRGIGGGA